MLSLADEIFGGMDRLMDKSGLGDAPAMNTGPGLTDIFATHRGTEFRTPIFGPAGPEL